MNTSNNKTDTLQSGIIYCDEPISVNFIDFSFNHIGCDAIAYKEQPDDNGRVKLVAYASQKQYNRSLERLFKEKYAKKGYIRMVGLGEEQVDGIF